MSPRHPQTPGVGNAKMPLSRIGKPSELAIIYLASPASRFATGTDIIIDGGYGLW